MAPYENTFYVAFGSYLTEFFPRSLFNDWCYYLADPSSAYSIRDSAENLVMVYIEELASQKSVLILSPKLINLWLSLTTSKFLTFIRGLIFLTSK